MKQKLLLSLVLLLGLFTGNQALASCNNVTYTALQAGNTVSFSASVPAGYVINTYYWTFGDGGNSNAANPVHTYSNVGWYYACMTVSGVDANNGVFQCSYCDSIYIPNNAPCNASYTATTSGLTAAFTNTATGPGVITNYAWNFGDGNQSNLPNPVHTYAANGTYNACLTIYGIDNGITYTCTWCDSITVGANNQPCNASFMSTVAGNTATFTNTATGPGVITGYAWTFGDGGTSALPNPVHTYLNSGWYNVCLTITGIDNNMAYTCSTCDSIYIQVAGGNPCNGVSFATSQAGNTATFNAVTPPGYMINTYYWTFGDGGNSNLANPTHTYANNGWYNVCMTVSGTTPNNQTFQCNYCDSIYVGNNVPCNASFITTTSGLTAAFTNTANGPGMITGYAWTFGDGGVSSLPNPTHTYLNTGWYNVCLTITGIDNGQTYSCTWCDSIFVQGPGANPCNGVSFSTSQAGNTATFNAVTPPGYVINTYYWTFGDGGNSNLANPTHTYANNGWYNVCMTVSGTTPNNGVFQCNYCDSIYVGNNAPCNASFITTTSGLTAAFTNTANGPGMITGYAWTFGDGGVSSLPNPTHTYLNTGWYNVCLTITGIDNGQTYSCSWCDSLYVQGPANPCNGVYFNAVLSGNAATFNAVLPAGYAANTYSWTFGDGGTSNLANPTHVYAVNGFYNVCMVVSGTANNTPFQCSVCDSIQVFASGVDDFETGNTLHVYPNPATNYLEIDIPVKNNYRLAVYDIAGKLLTEKNLNDHAGKYKLNTEALSKGMYFIRLWSGSEKYQTNFVKQ